MSAGGTGVAMLLSLAINGGEAMPTIREIWYCQSRPPALEQLRLELNRDNGDARLIAAHKVLDGKFKMEPGHLVAFFLDEDGSHREIMIGLESGRMRSVTHMVDGTREKGAPGNCMLLGKEA